MSLCFGGRFVGSAPIWGYPADPNQPYARNNGHVAAYSVPVMPDPSSPISPFEPLEEGEDSGEYTESEEAEEDLLAAEEDLLAGVGPQSERTTFVLEGYSIEGVLGRGSMGTVYAASAVGAKFPLALKVLKFDGPDDKMALERFRREVEAVAHLKHPGVPGFHDAGQLEDGRFYLAMERLDGSDLDQLWSTGKCPRIELVEYICGSLGPLAAAHDHEIVHRDLKPANIFVADGGQRVVLLDFGVARQAGDARMRTATGIALGTPAYMSPEQVNAPSTAGPASDIWSAGVMLYEAISGELPFDGESVHALLIAVCTQKPVPITEKDYQIHPALAALVMKCLEADPGARWQTAGELQAALGALLQQDDVRATLMAAKSIVPPAPRAQFQTDPTMLAGSMGALVTASTATPEASTGPVFGTTDPTAEVYPRRKKSHGVLLGVFAAAVGAGLLTWVALSGPAAETPDPNPVEVASEPRELVPADNGLTETAETETETEAETETETAETETAETETAETETAETAETETAETETADTPTMRRVARRTMSAMTAEPPDSMTASTSAAGGDATETTVTTSTATPMEQTTMAAVETEMETPPRLTKRRVVRRRVPMDTMNSTMEQQRPGFVTF